MDMRLNPHLIKQLREQQAWSQNHLAEVSGLSLRTVQRIEKTGVCAYESARSLAAVFATSVQALEPQSNESAPTLLSRFKQHSAKQWRLMAGALVGAVAVLMISTAQADNVKLAIRFAQNNGTPIDFALENPNGVSGEFMVDDNYRVDLKPTADGDGLVLISVQFFKKNGADYQLIARPKLLTKEDETALITFGVEQETFSLWVTPSLSG